MKPDISMDQKAIIQQLLGKMPDKGNQINIIQIGEINGAKTGFNFEQFLDLLPEPRFESLCNMAKQVAADKFDTAKQAAEWLGISRQTISSFKLIQGGNVEDDRKRIGE